LWELNELRNRKIHKILTSMIATNGGVSIDRGHIEHLTIGWIGLEWNASKRELTYMRIPRGGKANSQMSIPV
jgi:hypothetical protein